MIKMNFLLSDLPPDSPLIQSPNKVDWDSPAPLSFRARVLASNEIEIGKFTQSFDPRVLHRLIHDFNILVSPSDAQPAASSPLRLADKLVASVTHEIGLLESTRQYCSDYISSLGSFLSLSLHSSSTLCFCWYREW